jgi:hypothetical protein
MITSFEYDKPGPKRIHGGVSLQFEPADEFLFTSRAVWPEPSGEAAGMEAAIQRAVREVLNSHQTTRAVTLLAITWDDLASCQVGFERAARAATLRALGQAPQP